MPMLRNSLRLALSASVIAFAIPVTAQDASVYINQINPTLPNTNPRRDTTQQVDRVLQSSSTTAGKGLQSSNGVGTNVAAPAISTSPILNGVPAASLVGNGAKSQSENVAILNQYGSGNTGSITQTGIGNYALTNVSGSNNVTSQTQAGGSGNSSVIGVTGSDNIVTSGQYGANNNVNLTFNGSGYNINSQQNGSGLSYTLSTTQTGTPQVPINQPGAIPASGQTITVTQTRIGSGVTPGVPSLSSGGVSGTTPVR